ncbi:MAG: nuclear transport factor 2 family protein [Candidatus Neomarinimicrobiota bacterium]
MAVALAMLPACSPSPDRAAISADVLAVLDRQQAAWNAGDIEGFMAGYAQGDSTRFVGGSGPTTGWQQVLDGYRRRYPDTAAMGWLTFSHTVVEVISSDAALVVGRYALQREADAPWGWFTLLLRRTPDGWRIVHDHTSAGES